jgi:hypothetical protein
MFMNLFCKRAMIIIKPRLEKLYNLMLNLQAHQY